jgi:predicted nucleic acid-binding protein
MKGDRIFLDANVLFSLAYGSPGLNHLWELAKEEFCLLFTSQYAVEEASRNLDNPDQLKKLKTYLSEVRIIPEVDPNLPCPIDLPEKDRPVLMAAISINADYLITGDVKHFGEYFGQITGGVRICRARDYLKKREGREIKPINYTK